MSAAKELLLLMELHEQMVFLQFDKIEEADGLADPDEFNKKIAEKNGVSECRELLMRHLMNRTLEVVGDGLDD